jgi:flagellin-specific chaperone FliS
MKSKTLITFQTNKMKTESITDIYKELLIISLYMMTAIREANIEKYDNLLENYKEILTKFREIDKNIHISSHDLKVKISCLKLIIAIDSKITQSLNPKTSYFLQ